MSNFWQSRRILVTGGGGFLGSHLCARLTELGAEVYAPLSGQFDMRNRFDVIGMFQEFDNVDILFNLAANVGGIGYNQQHPYSLYYDNALMSLNVIDEARIVGVKKFVQIGTVCAYPKFTTVPFDEKTLWDGYPEETNAPYGLAKRNSLVQLQAARLEHNLNGIYILPTNLYGPGDNFNPEQSHVIPALIRRFVQATNENWPSVSVWGTGTATRDFLFIKDAVCGIMLLAEKYNRPEPVNLGCGREYTITALVGLIKELVGYKGLLEWDISHPDGQPRRGLRIRTAKNLGWQPETALKDGLRETIEWYKTNLI